MVLRNAIIVQINEIGAAIDMPQAPRYRGKQYHGGEEADSHENPVCHQRTVHRNAPKGSNVVRIAGIIQVSRNMRMQAIG